MTCGSLFYFIYLFYSKYSQTCSLYYEISDIPILKYVQVNVFVSLNTCIMTVLVDLYRLMGAAMLVCTEYQLWDKQQVNESSPLETR